MRELKVAEITRAVRGLCIEANIVADEDVLAAFRERLKTETSP